MVQYLAAAPEVGSGDGNQPSMNHEPRIYVFFSEQTMNQAIGSFRIFFRQPGGRALKVVVVAAEEEAEKDRKATVGSGWGRLW